VLKLGTVISEAELEALLKTKAKATRIIFRFLMTPTKLYGEHGQIKGIEFAKNRLTVTQ
jgi:hypothetical protein